MVRQLYKLVYRVGRNAESHALQFVGSPRRCQRWSGNFDERTSFGRGSATGQFRRNRCACVFRSRAKTRLEPFAPFPARALPETIPSQSFHYPSVDRAFLSGEWKLPSSRPARDAPSPDHSPRRRLQNNGQILWRHRQGRQGCANPLDPRPGVPSPTTTDSRPPLARACANT